MSHVVKQTFLLRELECLEKCLSSLGLELVYGQKTHRWFGTFVGDSPMPEGRTKKTLGTCDHAIRIPGNSEAYEVGVVDNKDGTFDLFWDNWSGGKGLMEKIGEGACLINQSYAAELSTKMMKKAGMKVKRTVSEEGTILLDCVQRF